MLTAPWSKSTNGKIQLMYLEKGASKIELFKTLWDFQFGKYFTEDEIQKMKYLRDEVRLHEER